MIKKCLLIVHLLLLLLGLPLSETAGAQTADQEVFLQFRHEGVVNTYISAVYDRDQFFLSVSDLFQALQVDLNIEQADFTLSGNYLGRGTYRLNFEEGSARLADREILLPADDFVITEFGYYLSPQVYRELFGLEFIVDFNNLAVSLETDETMPVVAQRERERRRERLLRTQRELRRDFHPLRFDRDKSVFNGGFLDYNLTTNVNRGPNSYLYSTNIGTELLSGDLQGSIFGSYTQTATSIRSSGLRWRYGVRDNDWVSTVIAGQTTAEGLAPVAYTGVRMTNDPIEPRYIYNETAFTGTVVPDSEVELYRNNTLVDFTQADGGGTYRFTIPLTYGSSNYTIRSYSPTGEMTQRDARLQIPFNFLPPGEVTYTVDAGRVDNPIAGSTERGLVSKAHLNGGLTDRITATGGVEYFEDFHDQLPTFSGGLSARLGNNYLVSMEAANDAFYRLSGSVIYPNNASLNLDYTHYNTQGGIYNISRNRSSIRANLFTPILSGDWPLFMRWSVTNEQRDTGAVTRYRIDMNTRIGRANLRFGYRDSQLGALSFQSTPVARLNSSVTYNFSRSREIPALFRSLFARAQANYIPAQSRIEDAEIQFSRRISGNGRFQLSAGRNFIGEFNLFRFTLTVDFNSIRSNTSVRSTRNTTTLTQSLRGSVGYDSNHNNLHFSNRQQVGRAGVAMRMFIDNNNSGTYDDGDDLVPENAIRIDRAGGNSFTKEEVHYISQLQPYRQYNMTVNKAAINNPLLVPQLEQFSIVTDPNQFKLIEIPLYMSGIVEGMVHQQQPDGTLSGLGGLRLYLRQINTPEDSEPYTEELRTFSDGSFYTYEIPPGEYTLEVDPTQLNFLEAVPGEEVLTFEVKALAQGDFVEGLEIVLLPEDDPQRITPRDEAPVITATVMGLNGRQIDTGIHVSRQPTCDYTVQISSYSSYLLASEAATEAENFLDTELQVEFNASNQLYAVRTSQISEYVIAEEIITSLSNSDYNRLALLHHCESQEQAEGNQHIQLGAFADRKDAVIHRDEVQNETGIELFIYPDRSANLFRVLAGPYPNESELLTALHELIYHSDFDDGLVRREEDEISVDSLLTSNLELETFADADSAEVYAEQHLDRTGEQLQVVELPDGQYRLEADRSAEDREPGQAVIDSLSGLALRIMPLIITDSGIDNPPVPVTEDTLGRMETVVADRAEGEETFPVRTIPQPETGIELQQPPAVGSALLECRYPVQVGSFRGNAIAESKAAELSDRLDTDIYLVYNPATDLFALRTEPAEKIHNALLQLTLFRETDPSNQYAIVGQCTPAGAPEKYEYAQFVIPLIRYDHKAQAETYAGLTRDRHQIDTVVRSDENNSIFRVYAGPYSSHSRAMEVRKLLDDNNILRNPKVIVDPATSKPFDPVFKIYLGEASDHQESELKKIEYENTTGRRITVETNQNTLSLFDHTEFRSWTRFLKQLEELTDSTDMRPMEIFIRD